MHDVRAIKQPNLEETLPRGVNFALLAKASHSGRLSDEFYPARLIMM